MLPVGILSFGLASVAFLLLTLLLATSWQGRTQGARLIGACAATALWAAILAGCAAVGRWPDPTVLAAESLRYAAWIFLLAGVAGTSAPLQPRRRAVQAVLATLLVVAVTVAVLNWLGAWPAPALRLLSLVGAILAFALLLYVGLAMPLTRGESHDGLSLLLVSLAAVAGYDLLVWGSTLFGASVVGPAWDARAIVNILSLPLIAIAARRNPRWVPRSYVSRDGRLPDCPPRRAHSEWLPFIQTLSAAQLAPDPRGNAIRAIA